MSFNYQIRRSRRAKRARIVVYPAKVEVVAPLLMREKSIHSFVADKRTWIENTLEKLEMRQAQVKSMAPVRYVEGARIPYLGRNYKLTIRPGRMKTIRIEFNDGFIACVPPYLLDHDPGYQIRDALVRWMKITAQQVAEEYVSHHAQKLQLFPRSIRIKKQKSRWGSCGIHNDINLNWVLILAPPEVFEYVVVHELSHIEFRNHSADFWSLVAAHLPGYQQQRNWLKVNGGSLMMGL